MKRRGTTESFKIWFILLLAIFAISSCAPERQYRVLSFFFDGVPDPNRNTIQASDSTLADSNAVVGREVKPEYFTHKPYEEEKCKSCHEEGYSNALIKAMPELCYSCHEDLNAKYEITHGPVAAGACLLCHDQHMSKFESLLIRPDREICFYCHDQKDVFANKMHEKIGESNCTVCHNPHGGGNRGFLNSSACTQCHKDFTTMYPVTHGPVASGECSACHDSHASKSVNYLLRDGQSLCLFCHNAEQVFSTATHKKSKKSNCTVCHNPHGGADKNLLVQTLLPSQKVMPLKKTENVLPADTMDLNKPENDQPLDTLPIKIDEKNKLKL